MIKKGMIAGLILFIIAFFIRPMKNDQVQPTENDLLSITNPPEKIATLLTLACYDCHSNHTDYAWFDHLPPASWYVDYKIQKGKNVLNFSTWKQIPSISFGINFQAIEYDINTGHMPPKNYTNFHPNANLSVEDRKLLVDWFAKVKTNYVKEQYFTH